MIYFDNAATTLIKPTSVINELSKLSISCGSYGRGGYSASLKSSDVIYNTREKICKLFNFQNPENIVFTYNATYALNLAIKSIITCPCTVLTSSFEHNSTIRPLTHLQDLGVKVKIVHGKLYDSEIFLKNFENAIDLDTKFAVINHISNVFGYILPIKEIDEICQKHGIKLILDVSQSAAIIPINLKKLKNVVAICMPAHKSLYGVLGVGICVFTDENYVKKSVFEGGTGSMSNSTIQPDFLPDIHESGTPNAPAIGALSKGIDYVLNSKNISKKLFSYARYLSYELNKFSDTLVYFSNDENLQSGVVSFSNKSIDCEDISQKLSLYNICTRAGYHCSPLSHQSAGSNGTVRVSFSTFNNFSEIDKFCSVYSKISKGLI